MPWTSIHGIELDYPLALHAKIARDHKTVVTGDELLDVFNSFQKTNRMALQLDGEVRTLKEQIKRLQHENEFMLKQLDLK